MGVFWPWSVVQFPRAEGQLRGKASTPSAVPAWPVTHTSSASVAARAGTRPSSKFRNAGRIFFKLSGFLLVVYEPMLWCRQEWFTTGMVCQVACPCLSFSLSLYESCSKIRLILLSLFFFQIPRLLLCCHAYHVCMVIVRQACLDQRFLCCRACSLNKTTSPPLTPPHHPT